MQGCSQDLPTSWQFLQYCSSAHLLSVTSCECHHCSVPCHLHPRYSVVLGTRESTALRPRLGRMIRIQPFSRHAGMNKLATRSLASSALAKRSLPQPSFPVTATCPSPTCQCSPTPADLDIDRTKSLNGTMSPYAQHLIVSTGRKDWTSRIEDERDTAPWGRFTAEMKQVLGRGSEFHDVCSRETMLSPPPPERR